MRIIFKLFKLVFSLLLLTGCLLFYAIFIEPNVILTETVSFENTSLNPTATSQPLKIIQFSDTHLGFHFDLAQLEKTVQLINQNQPDLVVFTGDLIDHAKSYDSIDQIAPILAQIQAPLGKFAVYGNHDYGGGAARHYAEIMADSGFTLLVNDVVSLTLPDGRQMQIGGLDEVMLGKPDPEKVIAQFSDLDYNLLLLHEPDIIQHFLSSPPNLALAGHSHGGQVQIPFYGPLLTTAYAQDYIEGTYPMGDDNQHHIYVNTGLGTTKLPLRFANFPIISIITIAP